MQSRRVYLLMPWGRVGSNLLLDSLSFSRRVSVENEPTTGIRSKSPTPDVDQKRWYVESVAMPRNKQVHVVNLSLRSLEDPEYFLDKFRQESQAKFIFLERKNIAQVILSVIKAEHYAKEHSKQFGVGTWSVTKGKEMSLNTPLDSAQFLKMLPGVEAAQARFDMFRKAINGLYLTYEDILIDYQMVLEEVCWVLGIPVPHVKSQVVKAIQRPYAEEFQGFEDAVKEIAAIRPDVARFLL